MDIMKTGLLPPSTHMNRIKRCKRAKNCTTNSRNKQYYNVLDRQRYEKLQEKLAGDQLKQREMLEMKEREKYLEKVAEMEKEQKNKYMEYMNNNYKTTLEYKKERDREQKEAELEEEKERLKRIQRDMKEEQRRNNVKKANFIQEAQEVANHKRMLKEFEDSRKQQERAEYQKLAVQNYQREVDRENNYKKYFRDYEQHMGERISNHMKYVTSPEIHKQTRLDEIEDKNQKQYQDWQTKKEQQERDTRMKHLKEMHDENKKIIDQLDKEKTSKREVYQKMVEQRRREEDDYKSYQRRKAEEDEMRKKLYRDSLQYQTMFHKKENELNNYSQNQGESEGLIPGINNINSVGSKPLLRKANDDIYESANKFPGFMSKELNRSYKDLKSSIKPLEDFTQSNSHKINDKYDPITNPIPFVNQNPYIIKEKTLIGGEGASGMVNNHRRSRRSLLSSTAEKNIHMF